MTEVIIAASFERLAKKLRKKYPNVMGDVDPLIQTLERGDTPGDLLQRLPYSVYKVRLANSDAQRGKSGGYRVLYYLRTRDKVYLIAIYSKSEIEDLPASMIVAAIQ
ncbi:MAG: type II toxin-antitoxin system RelE/ParE family toxin [Chloroflexota bacterium]|nr:type II toxin-antitoxin system RelE/ParE family toxin [Chloroflexota bacterium]